MIRLLRLIRKLVGGFFIFLIIQGLSRHSKRMLVVTSLYYKLAKESDISVETLEKLNCALDVADNIESMEFPALFHNWIWDEELTQYFVKTIENHKDSIAFTKESLEEILKLIPKRLHYGRHEDMLNDFKQLFPLITFKTQHQLSIA